MKHFTIVRNGKIRRPNGPLGHYCGDRAIRSYPYRVTLDVRGHLRGPDYFVIANEAIDAAVQAAFKARKPESCERMVDTICAAMLDMMREHKGWTVQRCHVELTGTSGRAWLSVQWERSRIRAAIVDAGAMIGAIIALFSIV